MPFRSRLVALALACAAFLAPGGASLAASTNVAVAANFTDAANEIAVAFKAKTGDEAVLSFGSTGQLYTQITEGAPFEVFLSADDKRTKKAVTDGVGVKGTTFTYAIGQLVLYSADAKLVTGEDTLKSGSFEKIAIADPEAAPYGAAAIEAMKALGVYEKLSPKVVQGTSIAQAFQFVETGNAALGFVALGQIAQKEGGSRWVVPAKLYKPIRQDAVLLVKGEKSTAAKGFVEFLKGAEAAKIIEKYGYALPKSGS